MGAGGYRFYSGKYEKLDVFFVVNERELLWGLELGGNLDITFSDLINNLGNPEFVDLVYKETPIGSFDGQMRIYYPSQGFMFSYWDELEGRTTNEINFCPNENDRITRVVIYAPSSIQEFLAKAMPPTPAKSQERIEVELNYLNQWTGFTCITAEDQPILIFK